MGGGKPRYIRPSRKDPLTHLVRIHDERRDEKSWVGNPGLLLLVPALNDHWNHDERRDKKSWATQDTFDRREKIL
jgi:hypothetical protein